MRYPMKAERKKAREETDIVNVIEWRNAQKKRYFLLVRRPDKGMLSISLSVVTGRLGHGKRTSCRFA